MKSRFFSVAFSHPESSSARTFARHLAEAMSLPRDVRDACLAAYLNLRLQRTASQRQRLTDQLLSEVKQDRDKVAHALSVMDFLCDAMLSEDVPESDADLWADDLQEELGWLEAAHRSDFEQLVASLRSNVVQKVRPEIRRRRAAGGVFPNLRGTGYTVEVRGVRRQVYRLGTPLEAYKPEILDVTPVVSVRIELDEGVPENVCFQAEEAELDYLIDTLRAAKRDLRALQQHLRLSGFESGRPADE